MSSDRKSVSGGSSSGSETLSSSTFDVSDSGSFSKPHQRNRQLMAGGEVRKTFPRGHFEQPSKWSKDTSKAYYQGVWQKVVYPALKMCFALGLAATLRRFEYSWSTTILFVFAFIGLYQQLVAQAMGWTYMPPMDQACYVSTSKSLVNYMSITGFEGGVLTEEDCRKLQRQSVKMYPKMTYKVNSFFGDLYYSKMSEDEAFDKGYEYLSGDKTVRSQHEIDCFVRDNINTKIPLDGPQWRVWWTRMRDDDGKEFTVQIWKQHHSLMDGVSCMGVTASMMDEYSLEYFIKVKPISFIQQILLKLSTVIFIPKLFMDSAMSKRDQNIMTAGKKKMQGIINASSSQKIPMQRIKELSKKVGCTVNDILMSATSSAFKQYFRIRGDKMGSLDDGDANSQINVLMPANIRFEMYPTRESVQMENCFAAIPMKMPLVSSMKDAYQKIKKATGLLKSQAAYIYSSYAITYWTTVFAARWVPRLFLHDTSMKFTMAFSNVPGPVKAWYTTNGKGEKCHGTWCQTYVTLAGRVGICVSCISYAENYKISVTADDAVCQDTRFLVDTIQQNIEREIETLRETPKPSYDAKSLRPEVTSQHNKTD